jgi:hypothetical protein
MDLTGQTLGQYRIMEKIGRGGILQDFYPQCCHFGN